MTNTYIEPKTVAWMNGERRQFSANLMLGLTFASLPAWAALPPVTAGPWKSGSADVRGLRMGYVEQGAGPLVLLCHGFPELWISWCHQIPALAAAGYRVVAPDLRGYGRTGGSKTLADYTIKELVASSGGQ